MGQKNMDSTSATGNNFTEALLFVHHYYVALALEKLNFAMEQTGIKLSEEEVGKVIKQWQYESKYTPYFPDEVELILTKDKLTLIPKNENSVLPIETILI
jgi:hypothetical protein